MAQFETSIELKELNDLHVHINTLMHEFLHQETPVTLGPDYQWFDRDTAVNNLCMYRASKNWEIPNDDNAKLRRDTSIAAVVDRDRKGLNQLDFFAADVIGCEFTRRQLHCARFEVQKILRNYRFNPSSLRFPNGEGFTSLGGKTTVVDKLRDNVPWDVTPDCFELAASVFYSIPALKKCARARFSTWAPTDNKRLYEAYANEHNKGYLIFKEKFLECVNLVSGMRLETVPKDNEKDRVIGCEPFLNMIVQSIIEEDIRRIILRYYDIDLETSQVLHQHLIADLDNATVDFSNASNSSYMAFGEWFYGGTKFWDHICKARSPIAIYRDAKGIEHSHTLRMVSPMGNGFTFGYMTLTILAIARQYDSFAHVYGDDLIVDAFVAEPVIHALSFVGYEINTKKTFLSGNFRESCGGFYCYGYIKSFEFSYCTDVIQAIITINKVGILARHYGSKWEELHERMLRVSPAYLYGSAHTSEEIPSYPSLDMDGIIENRFITVSDRWMKKKKSGIARHLWAQTTSLPECKQYLSKIQYKNTEVVAVVRVEYKRTQSVRSIPRDNVHPHWYAHYMWAGRCSAPTVRLSQSRKRKIEAQVHIVGYWSGPSHGSQNMKPCRHQKALYSHHYMI